MRNSILSLLVFSSAHSFAGLSDISAVMLPGIVQEHYGYPHNEEALSTGKKISGDQIAAGLASLGGAVGGLFNGILFNSQVKRGKVGVAPVGIVEVVQYKP